tara:strand:+ start:1034 stop:1435 length:402 start_codon:yes stop_codon:yes gene_type:complete
MALNRTTVISIIATSLIIGLSVGLTSMFGPRQSSLEVQKENIINSDEMKEMCKNFKNIMNTNKQMNGVNNVMHYNMQRLHGQCYLNIGPDNDKVGKPVDLLKMTGCHGENFTWKLKEDSSIFDFCPDMKDNIN